MLRRIPAFVAGLSALLAIPASAQGGSSAPIAGAHASAPTLTATALSADASIRIDGRLDEAAWATTTEATRFTDSDPVDGAEPRERTSVRIAYDRNALYVAARLSSVHTPVSRRLGRRDSDLPDSDWFIVVFDSYHDHQGGYRFRVNPNNVRGDEANGDRSWDPVWEAATTVDDSGWTAEMRIPFSQLRFSPADRQTWGLQFYREIAASAEKMMFSYASKKEKGGSPRFGHLLGLQGIASAHRVELMPFVGGRAEYKRIDTPFRDGHDYFRNAGGDLKYRPSSNFTLDMTVNPDFGQIEADESQVNLSASETFFGEKRPFFIEGANIFRTGGGDLFYTRRIGRAPQGSLPSQMRYADVADATRILGAAKLTGRTSDGWSVGMMNATTARERARWIGPDDLMDRAEVEPLTNYFVGRVKRDVREGAGSFGTILTQVTRDLRDSSLAARLRRSATVAGLDGRIETRDRAWAASAQIVGSVVTGSEAALIATQRSSVRYFQRPDRANGIDSGVTSMRGMRLNANLNKNAGEHWRGFLGLNLASPGFETNDLAFQTSADRASLNANIEYQQNTPGRVLRRWEIKAQPDYGYNYGGDRVQSGLKIESEALLLNYWEGRFSWDRDWSRFDDRLTRGGPVAIDPGQTTLQVNVNSNPRLAYVMNANASHRWTPVGGWQSSGGVRLSFRPGDHISGEVEPRFSRGHGTAQYVTSVLDSLATETFGRRYIFAPIDQTTLSLTARANITLQPAMTIALVAQPFIASGAYGDAMALAAPRSYEFQPVSDVVSDRNFNTRTVNGTAAFRWEWAPGSSAYVVWQHRRSAPGGRGTFQWAADRAALLGASPENTLMLKLSYWVNP